VFLLIVICGENVIRLNLALKPKLHAEVLVIIWETNDTHKFIYGLKILILVTKNENKVSKVNCGEYALSVVNCVVLHSI